MYNLRNIAESVSSASTFVIMEPGFNALIRKVANAQGRIELPLNDVVGRGDVIHGHDLISFSSCSLLNAQTLESQVQFKV
jgi:hypothetical protein